MMSAFLPVVKLCFFCAYLLSFTTETASEHVYRADYPEYHQEVLDMADIIDNRIGLYKRNKEIYCGKYLIAQLKYVCKGVYKRVAPESDEYTYGESTPHISEVEPVQFPYIPRHAALSMKQPNMRKKRDVVGIVQECCKKSCTTQEMMSYCG